MNRQQRRAMQKHLTPEQQKAIEAEAVQRMEKLKTEVTDATRDAVQQALDAHKRFKGKEGFDEAFAAEALLAFANFLANTGCLVPGKRTDAHVQFGVSVVAKGAAEGRAKVEDRRIIVP